MTPDAARRSRRCDDEPVPAEIEFYFDPMCPWAYQTSVWIRDVRSQIGLDIRWRFFSLEEINRPDGKRHPWERPLAYGWTPMRVAAWLRRIDMDLCDRWYEACGKALHVDGRRFYDARRRRRTAGVDRRTIERLGRCASPTRRRTTTSTPTTITPSPTYGGFGVPIIVYSTGPRDLRSGRRAGADRRRGAEAVGDVRHVLRDRRACSRSRRRRRTTTCG